MRVRFAPNRIDDELKYTVHSLIKHVDRARSRGKEEERNEAGNQKIQVLPWPRAAPDRRELWAGGEPCAAGAVVAIRRTAAEGRWRRSAHSSRQAAATVTCGAYEVDGADTTTSVGFRGGWHACSTPRAATTSPGPVMLARSIDRSNRPFYMPVIAVMCTAAV
jgi:hypothetical protein